MRRCADDRSRFEACPASRRGAGATGTDSPILDVELEFFGNCDISGLGATLTCSDLNSGTGDGGMRLVAVDPVNDTGTIELNPGFLREVATGVCTVSIAGPQSDVGVLMLDEGTGILTIDIEAAATRTGSSLCGPTSGTAELVEEYDVGPLRIDPAR